MTCAVCKYFVKIIDQQNVVRTVGSCTVHPPQFVLFPDNQGGFQPAWAFPTVEGPGECGQCIKKVIELVLQ